MADNVNNPAVTPTVPTSPLSVDEFASRIKAKYPEYAGLDNATLASKVVAKYPEYKGKVALPAQANPDNTGIAASSRPNALAVQNTKDLGLAPDQLINRAKNQDYPLAPSMSAGPTKEFKSPKAPGAVKRFINAAGIPTSQSETTDAVQSMLTPQPEPGATGILKLGESLPLVGGDVRARSALAQKGDNLDAAIPFFGPANAAFAQHAKEGDYASAGGSAVQALLSFLGLKSALAPKPVVPEGMRPSGTINEPPLAPKTPGTITGGTAGLPREAAIENLRNAINPVPQDAPGLVKNLTAQLDTLVKEGKKPTKATKVPFLGHNEYSGFGAGGAGNIADVAKIATQAAENDPYRSVLVNPVANEMMNVEGTGYQGKASPVRTPSGNIATQNRARIGDVDARISEINKTLAPKYMRGPDGSIQQIAAIGAEQTAALQNEVGALRTSLAKELATRHGLDWHDVYDARKNYGQLRDIADTAQWYADNAQYGANKAAQAPADTHITIPGIVNKGVNAVRGNPANKLVRKTFGNYQPVTAPPLAPQPKPPGPTPWAPPTQMSFPPPPGPLFEHTAPSPPDIPQVIRDIIAPKGPPQLPPARSIQAPPSSLITPEDVRGINTPTKPPLAPEHPDITAMKNATAHNSPEQAAAFNERGAQQLFGRPYGTLSVPERLQAIQKGTQLQTEAMNTSRASGHSNVGGGSLEEFNRGQTLKVNPNTGVTGVHGGSIDIGKGEAVLRQRPNGSLEVANNNSGVSDSEILKRFGRNAAETYGKAGRRPGTVELIHRSGEHGDVPINRVSDYLSSGDYRLAPRR